MCVRIHWKLTVIAGMRSAAVHQWCQHCCRWDMGQGAPEGESAWDREKVPARESVRRIVGLISGDRGLILLATLFGVRHPSARIPRAQQWTTSTGRQSLARIGSPVKVVHQLGRIFPDIKYRVPDICVHAYFRHTLGCVLRKSAHVPLLRC